ncbi:Protease inhibitor 5 [Eufriesea mexicana]|uniref:Protease inhibitor 5 n=1 Tax=Eufriesea mexicana TaxID=516756 RepID=A0A310SHU2_9HYME|nr:PREDICTED: trypsin inhibitor-like [Eufriesea mexicana]OAD62348.1 Protease inhibitor 5 [Eufriesea mexicana]
MSCKSVTFLLVVLCCLSTIYYVSGEIGPECLLPLESGPCKAMIPRYGYNPATNQCEEFIYGGCRGNTNNFRSMDLCLESCS